jgi:nucleoside 2-deoxyribosyltransferase
MAGGRIYLAGPDVFLPQPAQRGARLKAICHAHGLTGVFPLDPAGLDPDAIRGLPDWRRIALANEAHIRASDALIANLTPFRGPSADPGTVFEVGFMRALGRPVFGWSGTDTCLRARTAGGAAHDAQGLAVEDFGLADNLMIPGAIAASGGVLFTAALADPWGDLSLFERCVQAVAACLAGKS